MKRAKIAQILSGGQTDPAKQRAAVEGSSESVGPTDGQTKRALVRKAIVDCVLFSHLSHLILLRLQVEWRGLTGRIELKEGRRVQFKLDLMRLKQHAIVKVGEWTPEQRLNVSEDRSFFEASPMNVTLVAITILVSELNDTVVAASWARG